MYYMISCKFSEFPFELCRKRAFNRAKKALFWSRAKILPSGYHAQLDSCAGPFLGVVQKQNFLEIYSPLKAHITIWAIVGSHRGITHTHTSQRQDVQRLVKRSSCIAGGSYSPPLSSTDVMDLADRRISSGEEMAKPRRERRRCLLSLVSTGTTTTISTQWRKAARNMVQKKTYFGAVATYSIVKNKLDLKTICVFTTVSFAEFTNILAFCNYVARGGVP